ncbi:putative RNA-binding protein [Lachnellula suecica]|uniref:Putative RNA-binding protein n=1 Tax=Lachnellula suecica TaxID=602035 RepID=A0A8T9CCI3_9HELO|nr:putative RNA-binding protein [Lachnellula suecica]
MLFPESDTPLLRQWIIQRLGNTSDADSEVLADYVLALLRHDGDPVAVRALFLTEIPDFLQEDPQVFTQDVFCCIQHKLYIPGNVVPQNPSPPFAPPSGPSAPSYGNLGMGAVPLGPAHNGSRKRSYNDRSDGDSQDRGFGGVDPNGRAFKQPRRGGARGGFDNFNGRGGFQGGRGAPMNGQGMPPGQNFANMSGMPDPTGFPGLPPLDPNNPMEAMLAMQQALNMFQPNSPGVGGPPRPNMQPRRQRCRDYEQKGFCARGQSCMFEHGENSIFVPPGGKADEYDPTNAGLMTGVESNGRPGGPNPLASYGALRGGDRGRGRGGFRGGDRGGPHGNASRRGGRAEFSSDKPNYDTSNTTIVVENIPEEKFSEDAVREFFNEFGNITEVSMRPYKRLAIVKYDDWNAANAAYKSPKVIFDNRFVKVYWFTNTESLPKPPGVTGANGAPINGAAARDKKPDEPEIDMEEFARKQQEVQKAREEKMKKIQDMENSRKELEKRQEDLLKNQAEEKRKLMERIAAKSAKSGTTPSGSQNGSPAPASGGQTEALKAQLAALEAEAQSLGIVPSVDTEEVSFGSYRGRGRGRGRGAFRARGAYAPRGFRGGFRGGRGGAPFAGGSAYSLDNRPKTIALTGVDFSNAEKDESLRQFLLGIGEYTNLDISPARTSITFKDRFTAEKFMSGLSNGEIPSVGKVDLAWVKTPLPPVSTPAKTEDLVMDEGDAMMPVSAPVHADVKRDHVENLDYDIADDEWGVQ